MKSPRHTTLRKYVVQNNHFMYYPFRIHCNFCGEDQTTASYTKAPECKESKIKLYCICCGSVLNGGYVKP